MHSLVHKHTRDVALHFAWTDKQVAFNGILPLTRKTHRRLYPLEFTPLNSQQHFTTPYFSTSRQKRRSPCQWSMNQPVNFSLSSYQPSPILPISNHLCYPMVKPNRIICNQFVC